MHHDEKKGLFSDPVALLGIKSTWSTKLHRLLETRPPVILQNPRKLEVCILYQKYQAFLLFKITNFWM